MDHAVRTFKEKCEQMSELYTKETMKLLHQYTVVRNDSLNKDTTISQATLILGAQESIISELRSFIHDNLMPILDLVERERKRIRNKYYQIEKTTLPPSMNEDPF